MELFPRNRYLGGQTAKVYYPAERQKLAKLLGAGARVDLHTRVFDRSSGGVLSFTFTQGCFGDEPPAQSPRGFALTANGQTPSLPYNATNMPNLPDDGTLNILPTMGLVDVAANLSGGDNTWVESASWATITLET